MKKIFLIITAILAITPTLAQAYTVDFQPSESPITGAFTMHFTDLDEANACQGGGRTPNWSLQAFIGDPDNTNVLEVSSNYLSIVSGAPIDFTFNFPHAIDTTNGQVWVSCNNNDPPDASLGYSSFIFTHLQDASGHPQSDQPIVFINPTTSIISILLSVLENTSFIAGSIIATVLLLLGLLIAAGWGWKFTKRHIGAPIGGGMSQEEKHFSAENLERVRSKYSDWE